MIKLSTLTAAIIFVLLQSPAHAQGPSTLAVPSINAIAAKGVQVASTIPTSCCAVPCKNAIGAYDITLQGFDPQDATWGAAFNKMVGYRNNGDGIYFDANHPTPEQNINVGPKTFSVYVQSLNAMAGNRPDGTPHQKCRLAADIFGSPSSFNGDQSLGICYNDTIINGSPVLSNCHIVFWPEEPADCPVKMGGGIPVAGFGMKCWLTPNGVCVKDINAFNPLRWTPPLPKYLNVHGEMVK